MNNQEILRQIVDYIKTVMDERALSSRDLAKICAEKAGKCPLEPSTICLKHLPLLQSLHY